LTAVTITHVSSHFFLRLLHVKHPVLTRVILLFIARFRSTFGRLREEAEAEGSDAMPVYPRRTTRTVIFEVGRNIFQIESKKQNIMVKHGEVLTGKHRSLDESISVRIGNVGILTHFVGLAFLETIQASNWAKIGRLTMGFLQLVAPKHALITITCVACCPRSLGSKQESSAKDDTTSI
jgi:hypothetical protein